MRKFFSGLFEIEKQPDRLFYASIISVGVIKNVGEQKLLPKNKIANFDQGLRLSFAKMLAKRKGQKGNELIPQPI